MKKRAVINIFVLIFLTMLLVSSSSYAIYARFTEIDGNIASAKWSVSLNQDNVENYLSIVPNGATDTYTVNVTSNSEVDVVYSIVISNLPSGVSVRLDDTTYEQSENQIIIPNAGTILYTDSEKTKSHDLIFQALSGAEIVSDKDVHDWHSSSTSWNPIGHSSKQ